MIFLILHLHTSSHLFTPLHTASSQVPNLHYEEDMAKYEAWQAAEKERIAAAKLVPKPKGKGSKKAAVLEAAAAVELSSASLAPPPPPAPPKPVKPTKNREIVLHGIWGQGVPGKLQPEELTATNAATVSIKVLK